MIQAFFFDLQSLTGEALRPSGFDKRKVAKVGILGAGMMGAESLTSAPAPEWKLFLKMSHSERRER